MLRHWPLALQEYSFTVVYCRGCQDTNADAISRWMALCGDIIHLGQPQTQQQYQFFQKRFRKMHCSSDQGAQKTLYQLRCDILDQHGTRCGASLYLLVVQDYFTKWADARPLPDQAASRITTELMDPFITYGIPEIVHSVTLRQPVRDTLNLPPPAYASGEYGKTLHAKLAEFTNLVVVYMAEAAEEHRQQYNKHSEERFFEVDDPVWLSIPTAGMWDPRWEGNWVVTGCKSPVNVHISGGARSSTYEQEENQGGSLQWQAPQCNHKIHDVMLTEKHQPEDLPVLVPAEDHVAEYPEEVLHTELRLPFVLGSAEVLQTLTPITCRSTLPPAVTEELLPNGSSNRRSCSGGDVVGGHCCGSSVGLHSLRSSPRCSSMPCQFLQLDTTFYSVSPQIPNLH
eukprot:Em0011g1085a